MSRPAIEVSGLSKRYVIEHESRHDNLRDTLHHTARKLWRRVRWGTGFTREEFWALRDVSFTVQPGEVVGIIGRNGAGKSTLLKILSRITEATSGKVTLRGRVASLLEVGTGFHPDLTGRENIFLNGAILGMSRAEIRRKFDEIVAFAEIERFLDTPVKRYSSGMYVRLAFAVAAHLEPEILIVDEVLAVGDAAFQKKCLGKMKSVAHGGRTVLFVSHNLDAVASVCESTLLLERGRTVMRGEPQNVISRYLGNQVAFEARFPVDATRPCISSVELDESALANGELLVRMSFVSSHLLRPPVAGLVIATQDGRPVFGTNMRMHPPAKSIAAATKGTCILRLPRLPLHSACYVLSLWLGDEKQDYDSKTDVILFNYRAAPLYHNMPSLRIIGPLDLECIWSLESD